MTLAVRKNVIMKVPNLENSNISSYFIVIKVKLQILLRNKGKIQRFSSILSEAICYYKTRQFNYYKMFQSLLQNCGS